MTFVPGGKKPEKSGRAPGTPNRATKALQEILKEHGIDPAIELARLLPEIEETKRADILLRLLEFIYPRKKAIEAAVELDGQLSHTSPMTLDYVAALALAATGNDSITFGQMKELVRGSGPWEEAADDGKEKP